MYVLTVSSLVVSNNLFNYFIYLITFTTTEKQAVVGVAQQSEAPNLVRPFTLPTMI